MTQCRRNILQDEHVAQTAHAGLWLDRYLKAQKDDDAKKALVKDVAEKITPGNLYANFYSRWEKALQDAGARRRMAVVHTRLAINLGTESVLESSIALHRTYGTPYIPGSALKGLAAAFAHQRLEDVWQKGKPAHTELFGSTEMSGCVTFYDALYVPGSGSPKEKQPLWPDIITTHHQDYYSGQNTPPAPADWDNPTPIPFLSATGKYLVTLSGDDAWVDVAFSILEKALLQEGIGAKTSSGYGRMTLEPELGEEMELKGKIVRFYAQSRNGKVQDEETGKEYDFDDAVLPKGWTPSYKQKPKVYFTIYTGTGKVTQIRKRYG